MKQLATLSTTSASAAVIENINLAARAFSHPKVFRIGDIGSALQERTSLGNEDTLPTGFATLNAELNGGGWQKPGLTEVLCNHTGIGEFSLLMKALCSGTRAQRPDEVPHVLWVLAPGQPWIPYAPALAQCGIALEHLAIVRTKNVDDALWAAEQGLKGGACRCVLLRLNETYCSPLSLRRLLQAAIAGRSAALLLRPLAAATSPSPAGTRIALHPEVDGTLRVELLKRRGLPPGRSVRVEAQQMACLRRVPAIVRDTKSARANTAIISTGWLENIVSGTASNQVKLRTRLLDPNRR